MFRLDDRRVSDLQSIQSQVINYWQQKEKLPVDLTLLSNPLTGYSLPVPPEFNKGEQYEYKVIGKLKFELCANFSLPAPKGWAESNSGSGMGLITNERSIDSVPAFPVGGINQSWDHGQGRTCFDRTIDKDIYPPFEKNINR